MSNNDVPKVLYDACSEDDDRYHRVVGFTSRGGVYKEIPIPFDLLCAEPGAVAGKLFNMGLSPQDSKNLVKEIRDTNPGQVITSASKTGWLGSAFVLPDETFGSDRKIPLIPQVKKNPYTVRGTTEEWKEHIGRYCSGNSRLVFAASAAFAGPLLKLIGEPSGGFHLWGKTGKGKSTALHVAASVWGRGCFHLWRTTDNAVENTAMLHNDGLLCLDELKQASGKVLGDMIYTIGNEEGKSRLEKDGTTLRENKSWKLLLLSNGEDTPENLLKAEDKTYYGGLEARLVPLRGDAGRGWGLFENIHGFSDPKDFSNLLLSTTLKYYGAASREFLRRLCPNLAQGEVFTLGLRNLIKGIEDAITPKDASDEVKRVARRFATVGWGGELATFFGVTGWRSGEAIEAAQRLLGEWADSRASASGSREDKDVLERVAGFIQQNPVRLPHVLNANRKRLVDDQRLPYNLAGYTLIGENGVTAYLLITEVFKKEVCNRGNPQMALEALIGGGHLEADPGEAGIGKRNRRRMRVLNQNQYFYYIKASILAGDTENRDQVSKISGVKIRNLGDDF